MHVCLIRPLKSNALWISAKCDIISNVCLSINPTNRLYQFYQHDRQTKGN